MFERTITVNGFSKTYAMTGWRIGWSVAPMHITKEINKLQSQTVTNVTSFVQTAGVEALIGPQDSVQTMKEELKARRDLVYDLVSEIPSLHCPKPKGAFYIFPSYDHEDVLGGDGRISSEEGACRGHAWLCLRSGGGGAFPHLLRGEQAEHHRWDGAVALDPQSTVNHRL